jgi:hypothetical protein
MVIAWQRDVQRFPLRRPRRLGRLAIVPGLAALIVD